MKLAYKDKIKTKLNTTTTRVGKAFAQQWVSPGQENNSNL